MIIDPSELSGVEDLEAEICIIGAGPAGLTLASELEEDGRRVIVIESGGLDFDEATQSLCDGPSDDGPDPYSLRRRQFGGTSNLWGAQLGGGRLGVRYAIMDETDFEPKAKVPHSGWPFRKSRLDPYYARAQNFLGIAPYDVTRWEVGEDARRLGFFGDRITTSIVQFGPRDVFLKDCRERIAASKNLHAYIKLNVVEIETNEEATHAVRVKVATLDGRQLGIKAKTFVLAAGGIENARLLLLSHDRAKAGIGNANDLVGRYFIDHYGLFGGMVFPTDRTIFNRMSLYDIRTVNGFPAMGIVVPTLNTIRRESLLNTATYLVPKHSSYHHSRQASQVRKLLEARIRKQTVERKPDRPSGIAEQLQRIVVGTAAHFPHKLYRKLVVRRPFPDTSIFFGGWSLLPNKEQEFGAIELQQHFEQAPDPDNRVFLSDDRDRLGLRKAKVDRRLTEIDRDSIRRTNLILQQEFARSGLGRYVIDEDFVTPEFSSVSHGSSHHMGTTRMHDDPKQGVVDASCRVHGMANLYVAGSSTFPTGGFANPTLTIVALAIRLADHLKGVGPIATFESGTVDRSIDDAATTESGQLESRHQGIIRMDRANEVAVITGVSGGIGRALAIGFARNGTKVVGIARNEQKLHETASACPEGMMDSIVGDVGSEADVDRLFAETLNRYGKIDILINNAAVYPREKILEQSPQDWFDVMRINVLGTLLCTRKALPVMMEKKYGRIINLGSFAGRGVLPGTSAYSVSKAAVMCLTKAIAVEIDRSAYPNILVNELIPTNIHTGMSDAGDDPMVMYPHARFLVDLPEGGPTGKIFVKSELFDEDYSLQAKIKRKLAKVRGMISRR